MSTTSTTKKRSEFYSIIADDGRILKKKENVLPTFMSAAIALHPVRPVSPALHRLPARLCARWKVILNFGHLDKDLIARTYKRLIKTMAPMFK